MTINIEKGNLLYVDNSYTLAHCISLDCKMGKGIARDFDKAFPKMKPALLKCIKEKELNYPCTILYKPLGERWIFNLITKQYYYNKPTYSTITKSINRMAELCKENYIRKLAIPFLGCGLDRLKWNKVEFIIKEAFKDQDIDIQVRYL